MHPYSTDSKRIKVLGSIGSLAFITSIVILKLLNSFVDYFNSLPYFSRIPYIPQMSFFAVVFMLFFYSYDRYLWKFLWKLKLSQIPNLNGKWNGYIKTSHSEGKEINVEVNIKQTWSSIFIVLKTSDSKSKSETASISLSESRLMYQYFNEPLSSSVETLHKHYGVAFLDFDEINRLEGSYFTCKDRQTHGEIFLERNE